MNTSQKKPFLSEVLNDEEIPLGTLSYFRERFRDHLYELVMEEFLKRDMETGLTRADVARRIGRRPEQITRWFGAPGNWTLETVSDLLLAIAKSEPEVRLLPLDGRPVRNYRGQTILTQRSNQEASRRSARSAVEANNNTEGLSTAIRTMEVDQRPHMDPLPRIHDQRDRHEVISN